MITTTRRYLMHTGASLFTWGDSVNSLGYKVPVTTSSIMRPTKVTGFTNNVRQAVLGYYHSALVTTDGQLYTWGSGNYGVLGHNDNKEYPEPKLVDFFAKNNLKVKQVALGEYHTVALTEDGDVWTWGWGGREQNMLLNLLFLQVGALGHGDFKTRYTPTPVKALRSLPPFKSIQCGLRFTMAINVDDVLYGWGKGDYGVFGQGKNKSLTQPEKNEYFEDYLKKQLGLTVVKFLSCNNYSMALLSDGNLYGWGSNDHAQMGIRTEIGVEIYETANFPTMTVNDEFKGQKIVDFAVGEDLIAILLDNNKVHWSGSKIKIEQENRFLLPSDAGEVKLIGCCYRCVVVVAKDGKLYFRRKFVENETEDLETGIMTADATKLFGKGEIIEIGGKYKNRYALVVE